MQELFKNYTVEASIFKRCNEKQQNKKDTSGKLVTRSAKETAKMKKKKSTKRSTCYKNCVTQIKITEKVLLNNLSLYFALREILLISSCFCLPIGKFLLLLSLKLLKMSKRFCFKIKMASKSYNFGFFPLFFCIFQLTFFQYLFCFVRQFCCFLPQTNKRKSLKKNIT